MVKNECPSQLKKRCTLIFLIAAGRAVGKAATEGELIKANRGSRFGPGSRKPMEGHRRLIVQQEAIDRAI